VSGQFGLAEKESTDKKAYVIHEAGGPEKLRLEDFPIPEIKDGVEQSKGTWFWRQSFGNFYS
jgi:hypothetical protein